VGVYYLMRKESINPQLLALKKEEKITKPPTLGRAHFNQVSNFEHDPKTNQRSNFEYVHKTNRVSNFGRAHFNQLGNFGPTLFNQVSNFGRTPSPIS
jgi:hypothetical protein